MRLCKDCIHSKKAYVKKRPYADSILSKSPDDLYYYNYICRRNFMTTSIIEPVEGKRIVKTTGTEYDCKKERESCLSSCGPDGNQWSPRPEFYKNTPRNNEARVSAPLKNEDDVFIVCC